jgi:hypothetical protein
MTVRLSGGDLFVPLPQGSPQQLASFADDLARRRSFANDSFSLADLGRRLWDLAFPTDADTGALRHTLQGHSNRVFSLARIMHTSG